MALRAGDCTQGFHSAGDTKNNFRVSVCRPLGFGGYSMKPPKVVRPTTGVVPAYILISDCWLAIVDKQLCTTNSSHSSAKASAHKDQWPFTLMVLFSPSSCESVVCVLGQAELSCCIASSTSGETCCARSMQHLHSPCSAKLDRTTCHNEHS